jgi:negative regulator of genetic competence, sporulation and motility
MLEEEIVYIDGIPCIRLETNERIDEYFRRKDFTQIQREKTEEFLAKMLDEIKKDGS